MNGGYSAWSEKSIKDSNQLDTFARASSEFPAVQVVEVDGSTGASSLIALSGVSQSNVHEGQRQSEDNRESMVTQDRHQLTHEPSIGGDGHIHPHLHHHVNSSGGSNRNEEVDDPDLESLLLEDPKKRRQVSKTKRAEQNRSAQKAFRMRREKYIKDLEQQAAEVSQLKESIEELRAENLQLRDYTLALQSRVIELSSGHQQPGVEQVPPPPAAVYSTPARFGQEKRR